MRRTGLIAIAAVALSVCLGGPARGQAGDVTVEIAAGGLIFVNDPLIAIDSLEVLVRPDEIRATYVVKSSAPKPRTILVAFALPDLDMAALGDQQVQLAASQSANFVAATFAADGIPVAVELEQRALAFGLDVSRHLEAARIPLSPTTKAIADRLTRLPPAVKTDLAERGVVRIEDDRVVPNWTLKTTANWRQTFQPRRPVTVVLTYAPVAAKAPFASAALDGLRKSHCIDSATEAAITRRIAAKAGNVTLGWLSYALTAGSNWAAPLASFRLLIEKPDIDTIVATCRPGLRPVGPTALEWNAIGFSPDEDLHVLYAR